ncbi:MAG: ribosome-associated translation inhibitor RaiA [Bacteroidetes bacterium]|jgi:putative sigma-54 modulation protein|nr:ribosome-associated translation inhibitor RaiA [Bacteroidota bacterium]
MRTEINATQFEVDETLKALITKKVSKFERYFDHIIDCVVFLAEEGHSESNKVQVVEIKVNVQGATLFCKEQAETYGQAIDPAVDNMSRQLKKYKEKHS